MASPTLFNSLWQQLKNWSATFNAPLHLSDMAPDSWLFILNYFKKSGHPLFERSQILIYPDSNGAERAFEGLSQIYPDETLYFPPWDISPYESTLPSESTLYKQFSTLSKITLSKKNWFIVTTLEASLLKIPPPSFFTNHYFSLEVESILPPRELARKLVSLGYTPGPDLEEPGTFSRRGEVFDIFPIEGIPVRMYYFDDIIEEIFPIQLSDNTTLRNQKISNVDIQPSPRILGTPEYAHIFKKNLPRFSPQHTAKHQQRVHIFELLKTNCLFENYSLFLPLFFEETSSLVDYFDKPLVCFIDSQKCREVSEQFWNERHQEYREQSQNTESEGVAPSPEHLYKKSTPFHIDPLEFPTKSINEYIAENIVAKGDIKKLIPLLAKEFQHRGHIIFTTPHKNIFKEFEHLLELFDKDNVLKKNISHHSFPLSSGFFYAPENILVLGESDIFPQKKTFPANKQAPHSHQDIFAEQMASLKEGDYIIHAKYGLGKFLGLESFNFNSTAPTDFITILYQNNDKVYVPVYRFDLVQKYASSEQSFGLSSLKSKQFSNIKTKAKNSAKKLAFDLLELQAKRETSQSFAFSPPDDYYREFEASFPFQETQDQTKSIDCILKDLQKDQPMDRLVCGDVGFGKTEVAMRAAFKVVTDQKQVAILVPTTILALQHYINFAERFKDFPIKIEFLSRFKSPKESKEIIERLASGDIDIVIGTHKLLSKNINFFDLGLVIIDEEQRFGVNHKEKLKLLKSSVDFLTLSATPIPRTLQLAFLGLKEISLIQTPPPRRQSIKSYITREDSQTIKNALTRELSRGGQVFVVHNRVNDIESYKEFIQKLVPHAKILVGHGQLPERELEKRIKDFYSGKYQILVSTTIIENGIDMPNVNTMIVNRADRYGLSQLHQLRGRIGRSDRKAYAYFIVPNNLTSTTSAAKRLKVLQKYAEVGSGFNIASSDLEIRGGGDILGAHQAGHLEEVGLELYTQLLKEAIDELKGNQKSIKRDIEINVPFPAFIPSGYIENDSIRLRHYKKLSNAENLEQLEYLCSQIEDIFGPLPEELKTLVTILKCRLIMQDTGLKTLSIVGNNILLQFDQKILEQDTKLTDHILKTFLQDIPACKMSPNYSVTHTPPQKTDLLYLSSFCQSIFQKIVLPQA